MAARPSLPRLHGVRSPYLVSEMRSLKGLMTDVLEFCPWYRLPRISLPCEVPLDFANRTLKTIARESVLIFLFPFFPFFPFPFFLRPRKNMWQTKWWWYKGVLSWNFTRILGSQGFQNTRQKERQQVRQTPCPFFWGVWPLAGNTLVYDYPTFPQTKEATGDTAHQNSHIHSTVPSKVRVESTGKCLWIFW